MSNIQQRGFLRITKTRKAREVLISKGEGGDEGEGGERVRGGVRGRGELTGRGSL